MTMINALCYAIIITWFLVMFLAPEAVLCWPLK